MKRYLGFSFADYYPRGGWRDFVESSDNDEELLELLKKLSDSNIQNIQIVDTTTLSCRYFSSDLYPHYDGQWREYER